MAKELTVEQAEKQFEEAKAVAKEAWQKVIDYKKKHKLKPGYKPEKNEVGKGYKALVEAHKAAKEAREEAEAKYKSVKPKGVFGHTGPTKYDYPEGMSAAEKKKFRASKRAEAARAAKAEAKGETAEASTKKAKKAKVSEEPVNEAPAKKPLKKKAKPVVSDDDED